MIEPVREAQVIQMIETVATLGNGDTTPIREVKQYWTMDGVLIATFDPFEEAYKHDK